MRRSIVFFALCCVGLSADTIYSDLSGGYIQSAGHTVSGAGSLVGMLNVPAMPFTVTAPDAIDGIDLALGWVLGTNSVVVDLDSSSGSIPYALLASWTISGLPTFGTQYALQHVAVSELTLNPGTYWLLVLPGADDTLAAWNRNASGVTGPVLDEVTGGVFIAGNPTLGAFDVTGTAVPEASGIPMALVLILALWILRRMNRNLRRNSSTGSVIRRFYLR